MFRFEEPTYLIPVASVAFLGGFLPVLQLSETESDPQVWRSGANGTVDAGCI